jgi:hypothetical protein
MSLMTPIPSEDSSAKPPPASPPFWQPELEIPPKDSSAQPSPASPPLRKPPSERKIQANRQNSLRSTGPRTSRGKRTVAHNAIRHGILAREVVITAGVGKESLEDFYDLIKQLNEEYEPVGIVEELLVQKIATCWWMKARVLRAENGEIRKWMDTLAADKARRELEKAMLDSEKQNQPLAIGYRLGALQARQNELRKNPSGLDYLSQLLQTAKSEIASDGYMSDAVRSDFHDKLYLWDYPLVSDFLSGIVTKAEQLGKVVDQQSDKKRIAAAIAFLDNLLERVRTLQAHAIERRSLEGDAEARSFSLPPADVTDNLLRYDTRYDRQLDRAMDQLERQQRQRRGEKVPPPLNINMGRRG